MSKELSEIIELIADYKSKKIDLEYLTGSIYSRINLITESNLQSERLKLTAIADDLPTAPYIVNEEVDNSLRLIKRVCLEANKSDVQESKLLEPEFLCPPITELISHYKNFGGRITEQYIRDPHFRETYTKIEMTGFPIGKQNIDKTKIIKQSAVCECHWSEVEIAVLNKQ
ncbi:hypothetical protein GCM10011506_01710 [Marivirga lumbricoides]|uniref:Uncharacterized protein n=1 Tax=Marivirga lumbricoides TaxID=1046115 RepID=A0ABQ1L8D9_9BACT|nr:hypothetical protein GCM10011506_01710 [Marivirga lumbricoides]